jgi:hypothetical protein
MSFCCRTMNGCQVGLDCVRGDCHEICRTGRDRGRHYRPSSADPLCTENSILIDYVTESPNFNGSMVALMTSLTDTAVSLGDLQGRSA